MHRSRRLLITAAFSVAALLSPSAATAKPKVAVMELSDQTRALGASLRGSLTDALRSNLAQSGRFVVIDKGRQAAALKRLVAEQKKESYKACYASSCQIPLGQTLAADTILRTKLTRVGSNYLLIGELVDLAKEAVTHAAQVRIRTKPRAGRDDRLLNGLTRLAGQLTGNTAQVQPDYTPQPEPQSEQRRPQLTPEQRAELERKQRVERKRRQEAYKRKQEADRRQWKARRKHSGLTGSRRTAASQRATERQQRRIRSKRRLRMVYGWTAVVSAACLGGAGAYYFAVKAGDSADAADNATSANALKSAADEAKSQQTTGVVLMGLGAITAGVGAYLLLTLPSLEQPPVKVGQVELDRLPSGGPTAGGAALSWGGRF